MAPLEVPYLIVGAGPVGLTAAKLLDDAGCLVVERRDGPQRHPAAHVVNARTLEIFRQAGLDMDAIAAIAADPDEAGHVNYVTRLNGELIGRLPFERQGPEQFALTPTPLRNISQHHLEPILTDAVAAAPEVELRFRTEWVSSVQDDAGVTSTVRDLDSGSSTEIRSRYVLAADGAGSRIRKALGIAMVGPAALQSFVAIHFLADLRTMVADRPGVLHFVMDPAVRGTFVAHDPGREWVFMVAYDPTEESLRDYDPARCSKIIGAALGDPTVDIDVVNADTWHMSAQVADRLRDHRIFLIGDAAHRFPPTGGLGLNTGVADAHSLVWKLRALDEGWAHPDILATYEPERLPIAAANCEQSTTNAFKLITLIEALGLTTTPTTEGLLAALADPSCRPAIDAAVQDQATHFDMIGLQLGYRYATGALARDTEPPAAREDPRRFEPDAAIGARLPHAWLADGRSTLDLVQPGAMTLLTVGSPDEWSAAVASSDTPIRHVRLGIDASAPEPWFAACHLGPRGAMLLRPDQHVAWRCTTIVGDPGRALSDAINQVLGPSTG